MRSSPDSGSSRTSRRLSRILSCSACWRGTLSWTARLRRAVRSVSAASRTWSCACSTWDLSAIDLRADDLPLAEHVLVQLQEFADPFEVDLAVLERQLARLDVDVDGVQVVDRLADGILELGLGHLLGHPGHVDPRQPLAGHVERDGHVHVVLGRAAGPGVRVPAVGNELAVGVEDRVRPQAGCQDVGVGHGDLEPQRQDVEVALDQDGDRLIQRHSAFLADRGHVDARRQVEIAVHRHVGRQGGPLLEVRRPFRRPTRRTARRQAADRRPALARADLAADRPVGIGGRLERCPARGAQRPADLPSGVRDAGRDAHFDLRPLGRCPARHCRQQPQGDPQCPQGRDTRPASTTIHHDPAPGKAILHPHAGRSTSTLR